LGHLQRIKVAGAGCTISEVILRDFQELAVAVSKTTLAIIYSLVALLFFDIMGLIIKFLSETYTAAELSAYRNVFGLVPAAAVLWGSKAWHANGRPVRIRQWPLAVFRGIVLTVAQFSFYLSLGLMSFATASTITYANALFLVALAVPLLGEKVGWVRWSAVLLGFAGVVMVMGPGRDTFSTVALLPLLAAFCYALVGVTARMMDEDVPTALINLFSSAVAAVGAFGLVFSLGGFTPLRASSDLLWIFAMGAFGGIAVLLLISAYRMTEQSNLAPFSYFGIPLAFVLGWIFYDEAPWSELFPGALLIILGGLMIIWRERRLRQDQTTTSSAT
jgi:drug/metabolite transporter (DMT)-like permease